MIEAKVTEFIQEGTSRRNRDEGSDSANVAEKKYSWNLTIGWMLW